MTERSEPPLPGATYNGFSDAPPAAPRPRPGWRPTRNLLLGGIAAAVGLGLAFGLLARPDFGDDGRAREPMRAVTGSTEVAEAPAASQFEIEINRPVAAPPPKSAGKLEVLPPDLARAAPRPQPAPEPDRFAQERFAMAPPRLEIAPNPPAPASRVIVPDPPPRYATSAPQARPSFDCRYARSPSEQMVCDDPELAAADRRLARAYSRAIASGIPARELRAEQDDWLSIRDDAARHSSDAVASVYEQRIDELNELAAEPY
jgi:uncharacterized protein YecT (DUF1311 family)